MSKFFYQINHWENSAHIVHQLAQEAITHNQSVDGDQMTRLVPPYVQLPQVLYVGQDPGHVPEAVHLVHG